MNFFIGIGLVLGSIIGSALISGVHLMLLWQPAEYLVIIGAAIGAMVISLPGSALKKMPNALKKCVSGHQYHRKEYLELLCALYTVFRIAKAKGLATLEPHTDNPNESSIFKNFPIFIQQKKAMIFLCDYLRMFSMGSSNSHEMEGFMDNELKVIQEEEELSVKGLTQTADGLPALGIVAAVLGVIHTMGSVDQPPAVLGPMIGAALVGTLLGVFLAYGVVGPMGNSLKASLDADFKYFITIKTALITFMNGHPPIIAVESARKNLEEDVKPNFRDLEQATQETDKKNIE